MFFKKQIRNVDFMSILKREAMRQTRPDLRALVKQVAEGPAPAYYVEYVTALKRIREIRSGRRILGSGIRGRMWAEICGKVDSLMERHPDITLSGAVARVLIDESASSFFITPTRAMAIYMECIGFYLPGAPRHETAQEKLERLVRLAKTAKRDII